MMSLKIIVNKIIIDSMIIYIKFYLHDYIINHFNQMILTQKSSLYTDLFKIIYKYSKHLFNYYLSMQNNNNQTNEQLFSICQSSDQLIHSKTGLLATILKEHPQQLSKIKEDIIKLSYSIKSVGIKNSQIGIYTQRVPLKYKQRIPLPEISEAEQQVYKRNYIHTNIFISNPLHTVRKVKDQKSIEQIPLQKLNLETNKKLSVREKYIKSQNRKTHNIRSLKSLKSLKSLQMEKNSNHKPKDTTTVGYVPKNTKSYSQLLSELNSKKILKLEPLYPENKMLNQIKKISNLTAVQLSNMSKIAYLKNL